MEGGDALAQTGHRARARARAGHGRARATGGRARGRGRGGGRGGGGRGARGPGRHRTVILRLFLHLHFLHDWSAAAGRHSTLHLLASYTLLAIVSAPRNLEQIQRGAGNARNRAWIETSPTERSIEILAIDA